MGQNVLVFEHFDGDTLSCEAMYIDVFNLFYNSAVYDLCEQIWLIYLIPRTEPD